MSFIGRLNMGLTAFREAYMQSDTANEGSFESLEARCMRYSLYWSMYENTAYSDTHNWTTALKHKAGLYKYVRNVYNPAYRVGNFASTHLWSGPLSREADGNGALPIITENESVRVALARLWADSNFNVLKDIVTLRGCIQGDVFMRVVDSVQKGKVYTEIVSPETVAEVELDIFSNVKSYVIEEKRPQPENPNREVVYRLEVTRDGPYVVYKTFLNGKPYGWEGQPTEWQEAYTFVPMVLIKHIDIGLAFGWSELHALRSKIYEADDLASQISDQIRKSVNPTFLMKGMHKASLAVTGAASVTTGTKNTRTQPGREEIKAIWGATSDASAEPLIANLKLTDAIEHLANILKELERDCPELQSDIWATGATSGRALRVARQRIVDKIQQRRRNYDGGLVRLQKMALTIGGMRGYKGYEDFNLESFQKGDEEHTVGERPVFTLDEASKVEASKDFWTAVSMAVKSGARLGGVLKHEGWTEDEIREVAGGKNNKIVEG